MEVQAKVHLFGFVQGIGYRSWAKRKAEELGIKGWIMNLKDGSVKALLEGEEQPVKKMIELMKKGPAFARVEQIKVVLSQKVEGHKEFKIIYPQDV